ncbi:MAG: thiamine phosphate synthase [Candidatus Eremiobacter antarcticus]|nr:thiamine phosphate synthase [Candidatus Eremiobacteraeota bacterium]MBC5808551.1 thiamine phosphate synthase [Candidatus Eremiobacteraeota bacterium]PZR62889.1 MAG: thiamine phosphate synthase [Candidatus Eremiobacter sp. RRmetagenome_bin22]
MNGNSPQLRRSRLAAVRLYLVSDASPRVVPVDRFLAEAAAGGVGMVQLREKSLTDSALFAAALEWSAACRKHGALFVVNDRLDIALACGADGVHLGQDDMPLRAAREISGADFIIGLSTHSPQQVRDAGAAPVDYIGVGPIHETPTKPGRTAVGLDLIRFAAECAAQPFFAIGGLQPENITAVLNAGATRVSVLRWIANSDDPRSAARAVSDMLDGASNNNQTSAAPLQTG